jgi:hypothetical protein
MKRLLAGLALAAMTMWVAPQQASALSLLNPFGAASEHLSDNRGMVEEVRFRGRGFGRGHFRGFRGFRVHRGWHVRRAWRPRYFVPRYYGPRYYGPPRRCRVIWTYYGPRRVCRYRWW